MPRYISVKFHEGSKPYTYRYDGPRNLAEGDTVEVNTPDGKVKHVTVVDGDVPQPHFHCKIAVDPVEPTGDAA